ncbi:MAG: NAD+ synthase [Bacteroidales bacterium]|nr:MAG: NAD+ synthase [Bacteroidales bacterium]
MKIALAQLNFIVNHFEYNRSKMLNAIEQAKRSGVELIVFSELSVCGYPPYDLLEREEFIVKCQDSIHEIARNCLGITAIVGSPSLNSNPKGKMLFNSAFVLKDGTISSVHNKTLLPTYDVFDEYRYFEPNNEFNTITVNGKRIAVTICEDLWDDQPVSTSFARSRLYRVSPMEMLSKFNPDLIINLAASPFSYNNEERRNKVFTENVHRFGLPVIYVNQVGANAELIFDGGSMVLNREGQILEQLKSFEEDFRVIDTESLDTSVLSNSAKQSEDIRIAKIYDAAILGIRDYFQKMGFSKATLGLSGGIDSAVTLAMAVDALGSHNLRVILMPSKYSSQHSVDDAVALAERLNVKYDLINIQGIFDGFSKGLSNLFMGMKEDITEENLQARIRGNLLMALSNKFGHLLLNTSNKSEAAVGYGTLYGDMNGALSVLGDIYKTDVYKLAHYINREHEIIPTNTIVKPPSAELRPDQKDSDSLPEYEILDNILFRYIEEQKTSDIIISEGFDGATVLKTIRLVNTNEYKRFQAPPILRVSSKAFGFGRRMPLVAHW